MQKVTVTPEKETPYLDTVEKHLLANEPVPAAVPGSSGSTLQDGITTFFSDLDSQLLTINY